MEKKKKGEMREVLCQKRERKQKCRGCREKREQEQEN